MMTANTKGRIRRFAAILLALQAVCVLILGGLAFWLVNKAVLTDPPPLPTLALMSISVDGLQPDDELFVDVHQETQINQELSIAFQLSTKRRLHQGSSPLSVEIALTSRDQLAGMHCRGAGGDVQDLSTVNWTRLTRESRRSIEALRGFDRRYDDPNDPDVKAARDAFWADDTIYSFRTKVAPSDRHQMPYRTLIDSHFDDSIGGTYDSFYCVLPSSDMWKKSRDGDVAVFAPMQITTGGSGPDMEQFDPMVLAVQTQIKRDLRFAPTQKPDGVTSNFGSWTYDSPVIDFGLRSSAPSDIFVLEATDRAAKQSRYSFWLGLSVSFFLTALTAAITNGFRVFTGRTGYFELAKEVPSQEPPSSPPPPPPPTPLPPPPAVPPAWPPSPQG